MLQHNAFFKAINQNNIKKAGIYFYFFEGAEVHRQLSDRPNTATPIKALPGRMLPWLTLTPKILWSVHSLSMSPPGWDLAALGPQGQAVPSTSFPPRPSQGLHPATHPPTTDGEREGGTACPSSLLAFCCLSSMLELPWLVFHCSP